MTVFRRCGGPRDAGFAVCAADMGSSPPCAFAVCGFGGCCWSGMAAATLSAIGKIQTFKVTADASGETERAEPQLL